MTNLFSDAFYFSKANFSSIFKIFGPYIIVSSILTPLSELKAYEEGYTFAYLVFPIILACIHAYLMCHLIHFMASTVTGQQYSGSVTSSTWFHLVLVEILSSIAVLLGVVALLIPGLFLAARYSFASFAVVLNKQKPLDALNTSWQQSKPFTVQLMVIFLFIGLLQVALGYSLSYIQDASISLASSVIYELVSSVMWLYTLILLFRVYNLALKTPDNIASEA